MTNIQDEPRVKTRAEKIQALAKVATIEVSCRPEEDGPEGSFATGDDDEDARLARMIREDYEGGNDWAWCIVKVRATIKGSRAEGVAYLGGCSYESEDDFRGTGGGDYFADMRYEALEELLDSLEAGAAVLKSL